MSKVVSIISINLVLLSMTGPSTIGNVVTFLDVSPFSLCRTWVRNSMRARIEFSNPSVSNDGILVGYFNWKTNKFDFIFLFF